MRLLLCIFLVANGLGLFIQAVAEVAAPVKVVSEGDEAAKRKQLALQLVTVSGVGQVSRLAVDSGPNVIQVALKRKDENYKKQHQARYNQVLQKYNQQKDQLNKDLEDKLAAAFAKKYTSEQLQYLIDLYKNTLNNDFQTFIKSNEITDVLNIPIKTITEMLANKK